MKNEQGFTLIELIMVLALIGILLSMTFSPIAFSFKNFDIQNERVNSISDARATMDYLTREIRKSSEVEVDGANNTLKIGLDTYKSDGTNLFKNEEIFIEGVKELNISKSNKTINIKIVIKNDKGKDYILSSIIHIR